MRRPALFAVVSAAAAAAGCGGQRATLERPPPDAPPAAALPAAQPAVSPPLRRRPAGRLVRVGALADAVAADPRARLFAVAIHDPSRLALVDSRTARVRQRVEVPVGTPPPGRPVTPAVFLVPADVGQHAVAVAPARRTPTPLRPERAAVALGRIFITNTPARRVDALDRGRPTARLAAPAFAPGGIAAADFGRRLAVVDAGGRRLALFDPRTLRRTASIPAGAGPTNVAAEGDLLFVADTRGDAILTFSTRPRLRLLHRRALPGASPYGLAVDLVRRRLHVTLTARNALLSVPTDPTARTAPRRRPTVRQPDAVAVDSGTGAIAVAGRAQGMLQIVTDQPLHAQPPRHAREAG